MSATVREIVTNFKNLYNAGRQTDDTRISDRQWAFILDYYRAKLLRERFEKGERINEADIQDLGEIQVKKQKCGRWFTDKPLPNAVSCKQQNLLTFVGTTGGHAFQKTTAQRAEWEQYAKFTARKPKWYQLANTLFLVTPPSPSMNVVNVKGVFESPREAYQYAGAALDSDTLNYEYPISKTILDTIYKLMADGELKLALTWPADLVNDSQDHA